MGSFPRQSDQTKILKDTMLITLVGQWNSPLTVDLCMLLTNIFYYISSKISCLDKETPTNIPYFGDEVIEKDSNFIASLVEEVMVTTETIRDNEIF